MRGESGLEVRCIAVYSQAGVQSLTNVTGEGPMGFVYDT